MSGTTPTTTGAPTRCRRHLRTRQQLQRSRAAPRWQERTRFATLLLYLNEPTLGGQTLFPKTAVREPPLALHPGKGGALLFYNLLPDGNVDDASLHAALPVLAGEKWLANFWVWDPLVIDGLGRKLS